MMELPCCCRFQDRFIPFAPETLRPLLQIGEMHAERQPRRMSKPIIYNNLAEEQKG